MVITTVYKYTLEDGNSVITHSKIASESAMIELTADEGKLITDGEYTGKSTITTEELVDTFIEIDDEFGGEELVDEFRETENEEF